MDNDEPPFKRARYSLTLEKRYEPNIISQNLTILEDLNRHCMYEVFAHLSLPDLLNVADTNHQLQQLAQSFFRLKYNAHNFRLQHKSTIHNDSALNGINAKSMAKFFRIFGHFIENAELYDSNSHIFNEKVFDLIAEHCKTSLKRLVLGNHNMNFWKSTRMQQTEFEVLQVFHLQDTIIDEPILSNFIRNHPHLREIKICARNVLSVDILGLVSQVMKNLEVFQASQHMQARSKVDVFTSLGSIQSLKEIQLHLLGRSAEPLVASLVLNNVPIEKLWLTRGYVTKNSLALLENLKSLKTLTLNVYTDNKESNRSWDGYIRAITNLPSLQELNLHLKDRDTVNLEVFATLLQKPNIKVIKIEAVNIFVNIQQYDELLNILKSRPKKVQFSIERSGIAWNSFVPKKMIHQNLEWIYVTPFYYHGETDNKLIHNDEMGDEDTEEDESEEDEEDESEVAESEEDDSEVDESEEDESEEDESEEDELVGWFR